MSKISIGNLQEDLPFGVRISGIDRDNLSDPDVTRQLNRVFLDRGLIVFEGVDASLNPAVRHSRQMNCGRF